MNWNDNGRGMMDGYGSGSAYHIHGMIAMVAFFALLVWILFRFVGPKSQSDGSPKGSNKGADSTAALEHLDMRLAKGELPVEEYKVLKEHLQK